MALAIPQPMLRNGSKGPSVAALQARLNQLGASPPLAVDGDFGPLTEAAVRAFQARNGLAADGIVGPLTWAALGAAPPAPVAPPTTVPVFANIPPFLGSPPVVVGSPPPQKDWYMLRPPRPVRQAGPTCWAAALSAWLEVRGIQTISATDIVFGYTPSTSCLDESNSLPPENAEEVFAEWGVTFRHFTAARPLTGADFRRLLSTKGHLILVEGPSVTGGMDHTSVVYGMGFDAQRRPDPEWISTMDPLVGGHVNRRVTALSYPIAIGFQAAKRTGPASCRLAGPPPLTP